MTADNSTKELVCCTSVVKNDQEEMTLYKACKLGDPDLVESLLKSGGNDVNLLIDGWSCLHEASMHRCQFCKITELLLEHGANVNIQDNLGNTPLHMAIIYHCKENAKLLYEYKADIHLKNKNGSSSVEVAKSLQDNEILQILKQNVIVEKKRKPKKETPKENSTLNLLDIYKHHVPSPPILKKRKYEFDEDDVPKVKKANVSFKEE